MIKASEKSLNYFNIAMAAAAVNLLVSQLFIKKVEVWGMEIANNALLTYGSYSVFIFFILCSWFQNTYDNLTDAIEADRLYRHDNENRTLVSLPPQSPYAAKLSKKQSRISLTATSIYYFLIVAAAITCSFATFFTKPVEATHFSIKEDAIPFFLNFLLSIANTAQRLLN